MPTNTGALGLCVMIGAAITLMISIEHVVEILMQPLARMVLRDEGCKRRFQAVASRYADVCGMLLGSRSASDPVAAGYEWGSWAASVRQSFTPRVPMNFLGHPTLRHTMVYSRRRGVRNTAFRTRVVRDVYNEDEAQLLLREDPVGLPIITDLRYMTSANRAHHAMHLAAYRRERRRDLWGVHSVIEWGGGYGDMARLIRRMNEDVTYTIIDLPEISALQYVYLATLEGEGALNVIVPERGFIKNGRINLISVYDLPRVVRQLKAGSFISTWAITESPAESQKAVADSGFFGAERIMIASMINENNAIESYVDRFALQRVAIGDDARVGSGNEYWFL